MAVAERIKAIGSQVVLKMEAQPEKVGLIHLPSVTQNAPRIGTVQSGRWEGARVVTSLHGRTEVDGLTILDESAIYCGVLYWREQDPLPVEPLYALDERLILLLDPKPEDTFARTEESIKRQVLLGGKNPLRKATVISSGFAEYPLGARVLVAYDVYDCLQVLPNDKDLPFVKVPEGQEIRIYKGDIRTVEEQVPFILEDE